MKYLIELAAAGFILGIALVRSGWLTETYQNPLLSLGSMLLIAAIVLAISRKPARWLLAAAMVCFGACNTLWHLDTTRDGHLATVIASGLFEDLPVIHGEIDAPPDVRPNYTLISLKPLRVDSASKPAVPIQYGHFYVKVYPAAGDHYLTLRYGDRISLANVVVTTPVHGPNPGSFDMASFLFNQDFHGMITVRRPDQLQVVSQGEGSFAWRTSEMIKHRLLTVIKYSLPFPESSFLGGVLLGLRSGLAQETRLAFSAAGVSHVLAVSGLHVTIISLFFMAMFGLMRLPRNVSFILIVAALILFVLITGARPSSVRAAIMNCVTLLFYYFRGIRLDRSFLLGIALAALAILIYNPLVLVEASFLFSFSAVLSLALFTRPLWELGCRYLRGVFSFTLLILLAVASSVLFISPRIFMDQWTWTLGLAILLLASFVLDRIRPGLIEFRKLPKWFTVFAAAQLGIQLGMTPLTALYFKKISITAVMANFIAIPLIGVIVQLGLFAGILGQIPVIGPWLALVLNAGNYLAIKLFLGTATFFGTGFPYPDVAPPGPRFLLLYYASLMIIPLRGWFVATAIPGVRLMRRHIASTGVKIRLGAIAAAFAILMVSLIAAVIPEKNSLRVLFLAPSVFGMGGGNAIVISTPGGHHFLIDAGPGVDRIRDHEIPLDIGQRVVIPALLTLGISHLDGVILSSAKHECSGGLPAIFASDSFHIDRFLHTFPFEVLDASSRDTDHILAQLEDPALFDGNAKDRTDHIATDVLAVFDSLTRRRIAPTRLRDGFIIHEETVTDGSSTNKLKIRVLNPPEMMHKGRYSSGTNSAIIEISLDRAIFLLTSFADRRAQTDLLERYTGRPAVLQAPSGGASHAVVPELIEQLRPHFAVFSPVLSNFGSRAVDQTAAFYESMECKTFRTDTDGAVEINTDGQTLRISCGSSDRIAEAVL